MTRKRYPVVLGIGLNKREQYLFKYWLGEKIVSHHLPLQTHPSSFVHGLHCIPFSDHYTIQQIAEWNLPLLVVTSGDLKVIRNTLFPFLFETGCAALWVLPKVGNSIKFPHIEFPQRNQKVFIVEENENYRRIYRQILYFMGYQRIRIDIHTLQEFHDILSVEDPPNLIICSLDHPSIRASEIILSLDSVIQKKRDSHLDLSVIFTKDFSIPGSSTYLLNPSLKNYTNRIFSKAKAVFALLESFLCREPDENTETENLRKILFEKYIKFSKKNIESSELPNSILFSWLYDYLEKKTGEEVFLA